MRNGYTPSKANPEFWEGGDIPWFRMEDIRTNGRILSDSIQHITQEAVKGGKLFPANSIILSTTATIGEHALLLCDALSNQRFTNFSIKETFREKLAPKFLFYYMFKIGEWCRNNVNSSSFASVEIAKLKKVVIPIPPMRVQTEIVRILDEYTEKYEALKFELSAELELRKKQYYYYREKLLKFTNDTAVFVALSEVATIYGGLSGKRKEDFENGNAYYITYKNIFSNISVDLSILEKVQISEGEKQHKVKKGDVLFTGSSENLEDVAISSVLTKNFEEDIFLNSFSFGLRFNENIAILPDFAKFLFRSEHIRSQLKKTANGVTRYNVSKEKINRIIIPIPPIAEQERIVSILDKFDSLVNSISEGIPAEINLRQKQYEYYRNALLSFE